MIPQFENLLLTLERAGIKFIVVGGVAVGVSVLSEPARSVRRVDFLHGA